MLTVLLLTGPPALALLLSLTDPGRHRTAGRRRGRHAAVRRSIGGRLALRGGR
ncbi:hypothetical protein LN042_05090 [Kitasatospora sp. RB6PN24]|uniref:hypothetical protein n=1 Tax=Kitasatospora humi TaxID=2893891 RepID=UPI001E469206|nr:hypothetical protein [Kitasatospora humi]MCC9306488.1 hypothetical protein [Kitasatospora humi]